MSTSLEDNGSALRLVQPSSLRNASSPDSPEAKLEQDDDGADNCIHANLDEGPSVLLRGRLERPICVPQMEKGFDMPFARGYAQALEGRGISQEVFLKFIDGLNSAMIASPPLQVVGLIGRIIGIVPNEICSHVEKGIRAGVKIAIRALSKTLTDRHMRSANERIFRPAGLRASLCRTPAMRVLAQVPWAVEPGLPRFIERIMGRNAMPPPIETVNGQRALVMAEPPIMDPSVSGSLTRRLKPYEGYVLPITFDVPPPSTPSNIILKMSNYAVNRRRKDLTKRAESITARRQLLAGVPVTRKLTRSDRSVMKKLAKGKVEGVRKEVLKCDKKESRNNERILWLVIVNEEEGQLIHEPEHLDGSKGKVVFSIEEIEKTRKEHGEEQIDAGDTRK